MTGYGLSAVNRIITGDEVGCSEPERGYQAIKADQNRLDDISDAITQNRDFGKDAHRAI
jgi:hypothetical protein